MIATIIIHDETNCKVEGLSVQTRRTLANRYKFEVPYARHLPSVKLGRWDGRIAFFQLSGTTYVNLLPGIVDILVNEGYELELDDRRTYNRSFEFGLVEEGFFEGVTWPQGHLHAGKPVLLRDYQVGVINSLLANPQALVSAPTGSGKTIITAALSKNIEQYGRSIVIVPSKTLVQQTEEDYRLCGLYVGVLYGDRKEYDKTHTICTWQSLNAIFKRTKTHEAVVPIDEFLSGVTGVIVDECHGIKGDALKGLLTGPMAGIPIRWGLTGTIPKEEFEFFALKISIGEVVDSLTAHELQEQGVLANCHVHIKQLQDYREFRDYQSELKYLVTDPSRLEFLAKFIESLRDTGNTLVLVDRIACGEELARLIPNSTFISGGTKGTERKAEYADIHVSDDKILISTFGLTSTGVNIPRVFNLVLLEPGKSFVRVIQSIGRGVRKAHDKDFVNIYDVTSSCKFSKRHLAKRKTYYSESQYPYSQDKVEWK